MQLASIVVVNNNSLCPSEIYFSYLANVLRVQFAPLKHCMALSHYRTTLTAMEPDNKQIVVDYLETDDGRDWRRLLQLAQSLDLSQKRRLLWVWPTENELQKLGTLLRQLELRSLLSVGCGNGLLEWILRESTGVAVYGLEVDRRWWQSRYAVKSFIALSYIDDMCKEIPAAPNNCIHFLQKCCHTGIWDFALLFCYFNNRSAFLSYLEMYKGNWIILIGPRTDVGVYTDPLPLEPHFPATKQWQLKQALNLGEHDVITFYTNLICN